MADEIKPVPLSYASFPVASKRGQGFLCVCGTFVFAGVGHFIARAYRRGFFWLAICCGLTFAGIEAVRIPRLMPALWIIAPLSVITSLWVFVDAYRVGRRSSPRILKSVWMRYAAGIFFIVAGLFVQTGAAQVTKVWAKTYGINSQGMQPTFQIGDRIVSAISIPPQRWDVVTYHPPILPQSIFVARVVGLPGETLEIRREGLFINNKVVTLPAGIAPYTQILRGVGNGCAGNVIRLGPDEYFILGDDMHANDSRYWNVSASGHQNGALPSENIEGVVTAIYWPMSRMKRIAD